MPLRELTFHEEKLRAIFYLVIVPAMIVLILVLGYFSYREDVRRTERQAKVNRAQIKHNNQQIRELRNALAETCHATTAEYGVVSSLLLYFASQPPTRATATLIDTLAGYAADLSTRSACRSVTNP